MRSARIGILATALLLMGAFASVAPATAEVCAPPIPNLQGETEEPVCDTDLPICEEGVEGACGEEPPEPCDPTPGGKIPGDYPACATPPPPCAPEGVEQPWEDCQPTPDPCASGCEPPCDPSVEGDCGEPECDPTTCIKDVGDCENKAYPVVCDEEECNDEGANAAGGLCDDPCDAPENPCDPSDPCAGGGCDPCDGHGAQTWEVIEDQPAVNLSDDLGDCIQDPCDMTHGICDPCPPVGGQDSEWEVDPAPPAPNVVAPSLQGSAEFFIALWDDLNGCDDSPSELPLPMVMFYSDFGHLIEDPGYVALEGDTTDCRSYSTSSGQLRWKYELLVVAYFNETRYHGSIPGELGQSHVWFSPSRDRILVKEFRDNGYHTPLTCKVDLLEDLGEAALDAPEYFEWAEENVTYGGSLKLSFVPTTSGPLLTTGTIYGSCVKFDMDVLPLGEHLPVPWAWEGLYPNSHLPQLDVRASFYAKGESMGARPSSEVGTGLCLPGGAAAVGPT